MVIVGIDAHKRSHTAVAVDASGRKLGQRTAGTTSEDHLALLGWAEQFGPLLGQSGEIPGFISAAMSDPASGLTVVVAFNNSTSGRGFAEAVARRLAAVAGAASASGEMPAPRLDLPWTEDQAAAEIQAAAVCDSKQPE